MRPDRLSGKGVLARLVSALVLVYATFNPVGWSFYHWAIAPLIDGSGTAGRHVPIKILVGLLLVGIWAFFLKATRRSIGWKGAILVLAILGTFIWALIDWKLLSATSSRAIAHLVLVGLALVMGLGLTWSHLSRVVSGQVDTDVTE